MGPRAGGPGRTASGRPRAGTRVCGVGSFVKYDIIADWAYQVGGLGRGMRVPPHPPDLEVA